MDTASLIGNKIKLGVLASGSGSNLQAIIDASRKPSYPAEVAVVISDKEDAYALERARKANIPYQFINPKSSANRAEYDQSVTRILENYVVKLVIHAGYMRMVGGDFVKAYWGRAMNIHPSLLPAFPGTKGIKDALEYGAKVTGVTVHFIDEGMDTGPIILQEAVRIEEDDTLESLTSRIHAVEHKLYPKAIRLFAEGKLRLDGRKVRII